MPKKTARAARPSQQRSKEEQWRRRMAGQTRPEAGAGTAMGTGSAVVEPANLIDTEKDVESAIETWVAPVGGTGSATPTRSTEAKAAPKGAASAARRATSTSSYSQRSARSRLAATTMSVEDEMLYIKADIRKLVLLTGFCLLLLIALAFVLPMVIS